MFNEKVPTRIDNCGEFWVDTILEAIYKKKPIEKEQLYEEAKIIF